MENDCKLIWVMHSSRPYFVFDSEGDGFAYFATEEERDEYAKKAIEDYLGDGWSEEVVNIVAGKLTHRATQINRVDHPGDDELDEDGMDSDWDYICGYELQPFGEET